jgi:hypothetical protein
MNHSDSRKILPTKCQFHLQNIKCSKVEGNKFVRLTVITFPASENNRSLDADVASIAKYFFPSSDKIGKFDAWDAHHLKGQIFTSTSSIIIYFLISSLYLPR